MTRGEILAAVIAGALGGVAGGVAAGRLMPAEKPAPAPRGATSSDVRALSEQISTLQSEVTRLKQRQQGAAVAARAPADTASPQVEDAPRRKLVDDPVFEAAVRDVVEKVQQERTGDREERRTQSLQRWADRLAEQASLSAVQKTKVLAIAQELNDKVRDMRDSDAGANTRQEFLAQREALRAQSEEKLKEVLSQKQMEVYRGSSELQLDIGWGRGGRGRRGD